MIAQVHGGGRLGSVTRRSVSHAFPSKESQRREGCERLRGVYLLFCAFGFSLSFPAAITVLAIVNLGLIIPSSPGFIGTFQFFCVAALGLFMIDQNRALSFSVAYHLSQWLPTTLAGYYYLNKENLNLVGLIQMERTQHEYNR